MKCTISLLVYVQEFEHESYCCHWARSIFRSDKLGKAVSHITWVKYLHCVCILMCFLYNLCIDFCVVDGLLLVRRVIKSCIVHKNCKGLYYCGLQCIVNFCLFIQLDILFLICIWQLTQLTTETWLTLYDTTALLLLLQGKIALCTILAWPPTRPPALPSAHCQPPPGHTNSPIDGLLNIGNYYY